MDEIKLEINHEKLTACGFSFESWIDMYLYVKSLMEWLESHNKNYTKEQYYKISSLKEILDCIDYGVQMVIIQGGKIKWWRK